MKKILAAIVAVVALGLAAVFATSKVREHRANA